MLDDDDDDDDAKSKDFELLLEPWINWEEK